ncbi:hypothetical protein FACS1894211_09320 [Clostridia bacterium]|nr:hypothetical protein FACS1894211_09320 [Clostridia bacterium]
MEQYTVELGRAAISRMGRDKGSLYIVCAVDGDFVLVADGSKRPLEKPKRKRIKHLKLLPDLSQTLSEKFREGKKVHDAELKSCIKKIEAGRQTEAENKEAAEETGQNGKIAEKDHKTWQKATISKPKA